MRRWVTLGLMFLAAIALSTAASAQGTIAGVVKDASGAVLPGVTVEAASPALIEKVRAVATDGTGQYRIIDLRPGTYTVTFTLAGFSIVRREGLELTGSFTASVNAELKVGALAETIIVTGQAPLVDVQGVTTQRVLGKEVVDALPTGRYIQNFSVLVPGMTVSGAAGGLGQGQDVGGNAGDNMQTIAIHGSRNGDSKVLIDGLSIADSVGSGSTTGIVPNISAAQEVTVDTSGVGADQSGGGPRVNIIPREGGNAFKGTVFFNGASDAFQGSNYTPALKARGLSTPNEAKSLYDFNPGMGGPIVRDKLWFYGAARWNGYRNYVAGMFLDSNGGKPDAWTWAPDPARRATTYNTYESLSARLTWQATQKNKISFSHDNQQRDYARVSSTQTPEATQVVNFPIVALTSASWSTPVTSRLLLEAAAQSVDEILYFVQPAASGVNKAGTSGLRNQIGVLEQSTGISYRGFLGTFARLEQTQYVSRASASYVTGAHAFKVGFSDRWGWNRSRPTDNPYALSYRFNNGVPNQITQRAVANTGSTAKMIADYALYVQDRWTTGKFTINLAARYEGLVTHTSPGFAGPTLYAPNRNLTFDEKPWGNQKDVTPRLGLAYDLFGNGHTALKVSLNKYIVAASANGFNPTSALSTAVTRTWNDSNSNFAPDCDLFNLQSNGECGVVSNLAFGGVISTAEIDPALYTGWSTRQFNWELTTSVQHQLRDGISANVGYFRRWYGNFTVTDNTSVNPADYSPFSITAPKDPGLPDGGGYSIGGLYDLNPNKVGLVTNRTTLASTFGKQYEHWNGVDLGVDIRLKPGVLLQGGLSTGRTSTDNCDVVARVDNPSPLYCHQDTNFLTQLKFLGAYQIPKVGIQTSATFQSLPGPNILANYTATNAIVAPSLGRSLSGGAPNVTVNLVAPGTLYGERLNQLDLRFSRALRFDSTRTMLSFDLYNALNANSVISINSSFAVWQRPLAILDARIAKISVQFDF